MNCETREPAGSRRYQGEEKPRERQAEYPSELRVRSRRHKWEIGRQDAASGEGFIAQKACNGKEHLTACIPFGMTVGGIGRGSSVSPTLLFLVVVPVGEIEDLIEGAAPGGLDGDQMLFLFCAGFEERATFVGFVVGAGELIGWSGFCGFGGDGSGMGAVEDLAIFGESFFVEVGNFFGGVVRLHFQNN